FPVHTTGQIEGLFNVTGLQSIDEMGISLRDTLDLMNPAQDQLGQGILVRYFGDHNDIRLAPAGIDGLDLLDSRQGLNHIACTSREYIDEHIGPIRHDSAAVDRSVNRTRHSRNSWIRATVADAFCLRHCGMTYRRGGECGDIELRLLHLSPHFGATSTS